MNFCQNSANATYSGQRRFLRTVDSYAHADAAEAEGRDDAGQMCKWRSLILRG
jgi:hypothetical protein